MPSTPPLPSGLRALVVFADPSLQRSRISRRVADSIAALPGVEVRDLYQLYPDFYVDVRRERGLLKAAPLVLFVFQLSWYAAPALLKEWLDTVLKPEWAGRPGRLQGKRAFAAVACAGGREEYRPGGLHGRPLEDYLVPLAQASMACGMEWLAPHPFYGADNSGLEAADRHAHELRARLAQLAGIEHLEGGADGA